MEDKSIIHFIPILWRQKKLIVVAVLAAGILTSIIMFFQPNYYRSYTTFYPVNNALLEPSVKINDRAIDYYGDDHDVDRLLSMAHSSEIVQNIVSEFNLGDHYKINTTNNKGKIRLLKKFKKLYKVQKTQYDAIELSIEDQQPEMARTIVEALVHRIDQKARDIVQGSQRVLLENLKSTSNANKSRLNQVSDSLQVLRKVHGIYNTQSQAEALATLEISSPGNHTLQTRIENYSAGISGVTNLEVIQEELNERLSQEALQIQQITSSLAANSSVIHIIEKAFVPIEKSRPRRSLYVLGSMFLTGFFIVCIILIRENLKTLYPE